MSMAVDEVQVLLESLSVELDSSLVLDDSEQHLIAHTGHDDSLDEVRRESILGRGARPEVRRWFEQWGIRDAVKPIRTPEDRTAGIRARWCIPLRHHGELLGLVSAFDNGQLTDQALDDAVKSAEQLAAVLFRRRLAERTDAELVRHMIHRAGPFDDTTDAYPRRGHVAVVVMGYEEAVDPDSSMLVDLAAATRRAAEVFPRGTAPSGDIGGLIAAIVPIHRAGDTQAATHLAETAIRTTSKGVAFSPIAAGISSGSCTASTAGIAYTEARRALRVARCVQRFNPIASWNDIGAYRALATIPPTDPDGIDPRVRVLHGHVELARTAEEFLDRAGDAQATADLLIIHRSTLYQRLSRIEHLCNLDLQHSGEDRLVTHIGLRLLRLT